MSRGGTLLALALAIAGCGEATQAGDADVDALVEAARGKQDGFAIETELGASHDLAVVPKSIVHDAHESDAIVVAHADVTMQYVAVAADMDMQAEADFQLDLIALDAAAPSADLSQTNVEAGAYLDAVRAADYRIVSRNAVHEDGNGNLAADEDSPLIDRPKIDAANHARDDYFAALAALHDAPEDELRAVVGELWGALARDEHRRR